MFTLHPQLKRDSFLIHDLKLCQVRLIDNSHFPWIILVPMRADVSEIIDLSHDDRALLMEEIAHCCEAMKKLFKADKLNVAALGNQVPQLHVHVIARFGADPAWPNPVWGGPVAVYGEKEAQSRINQLKHALTLDRW